MFHSAKTDLIHLLLLASRLNSSSVKRSRDRLCRSSIRGRQCTGDLGTLRSRDAVRESRQHRFGHGFEFGLFQRHYGPEPMGPLRWADLEQTLLNTALETRVDCVGREDFRVQEHRYCRAVELERLPNPKAVCAISALQTALANELLYRGVTFFTPTHGNWQCLSRRHLEFR